MEYSQSPSFYWTHPLSARLRLARARASSSAWSQVRARAAAEAHTAHSASDRSSTRLRRPATAALRGSRGGPDANE
eukprot:2877940-Pyramimonas_sp.AAC.1